jgi:hypothetical protein
MLQRKEEFGNKAKLIHDSGERGFQWKKNYYEHIIRNEHGLLAIQKYILNDPVQWQYVSENQKMI